MARVAYAFGSVCKAFDNACFDPRMVVGSEVEVAVCMCCFSVHCGHQTAAFSLH